MTTISNNKLADRDVEVELIFFPGKVVRGASPQDVGYQIDTRMQRKAKEVSFPAPFY